MKPLLLILLAAPLWAQEARYHHGDDPRWADSAFDDSAWPALQMDMLPPPPKYSDGVVWVRERMPRPNAEAGVALRREIKVFNTYSPTFSEEFWVDGQRLGNDGKLPPHPENPIGEIAPVFDLPASVNAPTILIARRIWIAQPCPVRWFPE